MTTSALIKARYERLKADHLCVTCMTPLPPDHPYIRCARCHANNLMRHKRGAKTDYAVQKGNEKRRERKVEPLPKQEDTMCAHCAKRARYGCDELVRTCCPLPCEMGWATLKPRERAELMKIPAAMCTEGI